MRVLIVGCGYIGRAVGAELVSTGHEVYGLRRSAEAAANLEASGIRFLSGDIRKPGDLERLPGDYDWVVNCVAAAGSDQYESVYVEGNRNLVRRFAARPPQKYVYTSSTGVYGQTDGSLVDESSPTQPDTETGRMLVRAEEVLRAAVGEGFPAVILRVSGIYGPGRGYWLRQFLSGLAVMEGRGERWLNMVHREDVAGAIVAALARGVPGETYNVSDDEPVMQLEVYQWLAARLGKPLPPASAGEPVLKKRGTTNKRIANRRLRHELNYQLRYPSFRDGYEVELKSRL
ncbi:MAG TPA: SDR family oxidoreductase [Clostridia bacterium]|nr:SDR family oxidoreductase [Clostridia bacterium]